MTFPVPIPLGPWKLHPHRFFEVLAYFIGGQTFWWLRRRWADPLDGRTRLSVIGGAILGAGLGAKGLHALTMVPWVSEVGWMGIFGGKTILGAILGGYLGVEIAKRLVGESRRTGDLFVIPLCLGVAIGRIGCFLTGLEDGTYGGPTTLPWGVDFGDGLRRHPTQLYESLFLLLCIGAAWVVRRRLSRAGDLWRLFLMCYCGWRLVIDGLKPYPPMGGLNAIQWAALLGLGWLALERIRDRKIAPA